MNGGFAELVAVDEDLVYKIPDAVSMKAASMTELVACAYNCMERCNFRYAAEGLILGAGGMCIRDRLEAEAESCTGRGSRNRDRGGHGVYGLYAGRLRLFENFGIRDDDDKSSSDLYLALGLCIRHAADTDYSLSLIHICKDVKKIRNRS